MAKNEKGKMILFCGPSGSGKTTIVHYLLEQDDRLRFSISATTRNKRRNETDGKDYYFLTVPEFKKKIANDEFAEWEEVYSSGFYGTMKSEIERIISKGKVPVFDVDVVGGLNIKKLYGDKLLAVFVMPPSLRDLHERLKERATETHESFLARLTKAEHELTYAEFFENKIINAEKEKACREAQKIVNEFLDN